MEEPLNSKTNPRTSQNAPATAPEQSGDQTNLSYLYGSIGIQAVAAAARYVDRDKKPATQQIDQRFVESAV